VSENRQHRPFLSRPQSKAVLSASKDLSLNSDCFSIIVSKSRDPTTFTGHEIRRQGFRFSGQGERGISAERSLIWARSKRRLTPEPGKVITVSAQRRQRFDNHCIEFGRRAACQRPEKGEESARCAAGFRSGHGRRARIFRCRNKLQLH